MACNGRTTISNHNKSQYAGSWRNCNIYVTKSFKGLGKNLLVMLIWFWYVPTQKTYCITSTIFLETLSWLWRKKINGELPFLDTLLKHSNEKNSVWQIGNLHILTKTFSTALTNKQVARKVLLPPFLLEHIPLSLISIT